jgi:HlyD family type I secretion membrane fusion protein
MRYRSAEQMRVLTLSLMLISIPMFLMIGLVVWACDSNLEESIPGMGQLVPEGHIRDVMSPNSGVVRKVYVKANDIVRAGQILMELDPEETAIQSIGLQEQLAYLKEEAVALEAAFQHKGPGGLGTSLEQKAWLGASQQALSSELEQARHQIRESEYGVKEVQTQIKHTQSILGDLEAQQKRYHSLLAADGIPLVEVRNFDEKVTQSKRELAILKETLQVRKSELEKVKRRPSELVGTYEKDVLGRLSEYRRNIAQLESTKELNDVTMKRTIIRAPISGVIHESSVFGPGDVVPGPSEKLFSIVPEGAKLLAEVKVTNRDFSYIHLKQKAALRLDALPYNHFGRLDGTVQSISPTTMMDPEGHPYYLVRILPDKLGLKDNHGHVHPLRAGMTVTADIVTRDKSIISFFTEPVQDQLDSAFRDPTTR